MSNDRRTLVILGIVFLALFGAFIYQTGQLAEESSTVDQEAGIPTEPFLQRVYPTLQAATVQAVQLRDPASDEAFTMARNEAGAWVVPNMDGAARSINQSEASIITGTLALLPYRRTIAIDEDTDLAQFGFRPDGDFYVQFVTDDGTEHAIAVGGPGLNTPTFYAFIDERPEIYVLDRAAIDYLASQFLNPPFE